MLKFYTNVLFENYINFKGRARRKEFWSFFLVNAVVYFGLKSIWGFVNPAEDLFSRFFIIAILVPTIAVGIRRMHDINKAGYHFFIPVYNIYLCTVIGEEGLNQYGPDPISEIEYLRELGKDLN